VLTAGADIPYGVPLMSSRLRDRAALYRDTGLVAVAGLAVVAYATFTPPVAGREVFAWLEPLAALQGDLPQYYWRFLMSLLLLGIVPFVSALLAGERPRDLGLAVPRRVAPAWVWVVVAAGSVAVAVIGAYGRETSSYYPYSKTLLRIVADRGFGAFALHALLYFTMFYLPWELLFRGILVFPLLRFGAGGSPAVLLFLASVQAVPSGLLHIGHPAVESLGSVFFGIAAGYLAMRSRSILPSLAIHAGIGILQDLILALRFTGFLP
jgi:hypothetical protein